MDNSNFPSTTTTSLHSQLKDVESGLSPEHQADAYVLVQDVEKDSKAPQVPEAAPSAQENKPYSGLRWFFVCVALYTSGFLYGLDNTIVADIQASVVETFGQVEKLGWLGIGFPLGSIAIILSLGKAYGTFDVKWLYIVSLVNFAAGSALCGAAPNINALIVGRVWAGAGGAGIYLGLLNVITVNTTDRERPIYMSLGGLIWGTGCLLGPVIGGAFADSKATWRWAFYINLVLFGIASPIYVFILRSYQPQPDKSRAEKLKHVDWAGVFLNAALFTCFVCVFTFAGAQWSWKSGGTIALFVLLGVAFIAFAVQQSFSVFTSIENRIFPVDFLKHRTMVLLYVGTAAAASGLFIPLYYIPLFFAFARGESGMQSAVRLLPFVCIMVFSTMLNGALMPRFGVYQPWYMAAGIFLTVGGALMYSLVDANTSKSTIYGFSVLIALGAGLSQQAAYSVAPIKVMMNPNLGHRRIADAIGFINIAQIGTVVIALTMTSSIFQNIGYRNVAAVLHGLNFTSTDIHAALAGTKSAIFTSPEVTPELRAKVIAAIVKAIGDGYILVTVAGGILLLTSLFMRRERLFMEAGAAA